MAVERNPCCSRFILKECRPWEGPMQELFMKDTGAGEEHEEEGAAERNCCEWTATPISHLPVLLGTRRTYRTQE